MAIRSRHLSAHNLIDKQTSTCAIKTTTSSLPKPGRKISSLLIYAGMYSKMHSLLDTQKSHRHHTLVTPTANISIQATSSATSHNHIIITPTSTRMNNHSESLPRNPLIHRLPIRMIANLHIPTILLLGRLLLLPRPQTRRSSINRLDRRSRLVEMRRLVRLIPVHDIRLGIAHMVSSGFARSNRSSPHASRGRPGWFAGLADGCDAWLLDVCVEDRVLGFVALAGGGLFLG